MNCGTRIADCGKRKTGTIYGDPAVAMEFNRRMGLRIADCGLRKGLRIARLGKNEVVFSER